MTIYQNSVSDLLWNSLNKLMQVNYLSEFQLVGGTSNRTQNAFSIRLIVVYVTNLRNNYFTS